MRREDIIHHIVAVSGEDLIISTTGQASRELFETRVMNGQSHKYDFLTGNSNKLADYTASWNVWGSSSSHWLDNFSGLGAIGDKFVVTTPDKVLVIDKNGGSPQTKYTLSAVRKHSRIIYVLMLKT